MTWPRVALLSLADKSGARELARALIEHGARVLASGGTARFLSEAGLPVTPVERWTGASELLEGRVKTLHPRVHAAILARRDRASDRADLERLDLDPIDLVAVTLYPFEERAPGLDEPGAIEEIDIGGVALLRAAAKNFDDVIVIHDPGQYPALLESLGRDGPCREERRALAVAAFARTARYDAAIAGDLSRRAPDDPAATPRVRVSALELVRTLRYGENPHQSAALYAEAGDRVPLAALREGKELSFNNLLDLEAAVALTGRFSGPACVIVKHGQPCGAARAERLVEAFERALASDELSAFGGVVAFNRPLDPATAGVLAEHFVECVAAPAFEPDAVAALASKKNLRLVTLAAADVTPASREAVRHVGRWVLVQRDPDAGEPEPRVVTRRAPGAEEQEGLRFAWEIVAAARSNAIVIARGAWVIGIGSGQTSRVDAVDVALMKARRAGHELAGAVLASDGFFPFPDGVEHAAAAGVSAVVQPGGSMRDADVIAACDRLGLAMTFTDRRVFRH